MRRAPAFLARDPGFKAQCLHFNRISSWERLSSELLDGQSQKSSARWINSQSLIEAAPFQIASKHLSNRQPVHGTARAATFAIGKKTHKTLNPSLGFPMCRKKQKVPRGQEVQRLMSTQVRQPIAVFLQWLCARFLTACSYKPLLLACTADIPRSSTTAPGSGRRR